MFILYEGNNCFIIPKLLQDVQNLAVLFFSKQHNNFLYRKYNYGLKNRQYISQTKNRQYIGQTKNRQYIGQTKNR